MSKLNLDRITAGREQVRALAAALDIGPDEQVVAAEMADWAFAHIAPEIGKEIAARRVADGDNFMRYLLAMMLSVTDVAIECDKTDA